MKKNETAKIGDADQIYNVVLDEITATAPDLSDIINDFRKMSYGDLKLAEQHSKNLGRVATPTGSTPIQFNVSCVKTSAGKPGAIKRREDYYTRGVDTLEEDQERLAQFKRIGSRTDYLERTGRFKNAKQEDVQFILTNMGGNRAERQRTAAGIETAEKSVKEGGKRRRHVNNAILMFSAIIAYPSELSKAEHEWITRQICEPIEKAGVFFLAVGHKPSAKGDQRNHHLHLIYSQRPFSRDANGEIVFAEKINRDLQHPRFLRDLRQLTVTACNEALAAAGRPRRLFAGTYADNGFPAARARKRIPIRLYQAMRNDRLKNEAAGLNSNSTDNDELALVRFMTYIVNTVDARIAQKQELAAAAEKATAARQARLKAVHDAMNQILRSGALFAVDKETKNVKLADIRGGHFSGFLDVRGQKAALPRINSEAARIIKLVDRIGEAFEEWIAANGPKLMKSWAQVPGLTLKTLERLGGQVCFTSNGAISVRPRGNTWAGKGVLSWLADAVRNHGASVLTQHLTCVDTNLARQPLPHATSTNSSVATHYAVALAHGQAMSPRALAGVRRDTAMRHNIRLARDTIKQIDERIERDLHNWTTAPYLVQQHRSIVSHNTAYSAQAMGLETEHKRYQSALSALEAETRNFPGTFTPIVRELLSASVAYFGTTGWEEGLERDLVKKLDRVSRAMADRIAGMFEGRTLELPTGESVASSKIAALAQRALNCTSVVKARANARGEERTR